MIVAIHGNLNECNSSGAHITIGEGRQYPFLRMVCREKESPKVGMVSEHNNYEDIWATFDNEQMLSWLEACHEVISERIESGVDNE